MGHAAELRPRAVLLAVTGVPGAGKTTLGSAIAGALGVPFLSLDAIKESLYAERAEQTVDLHALRLAAERELSVQLAAIAGSVVVDLWIAPERDTDRITTLFQQDRRGVVELLLRVPSDVAVARYVRRHRGGPHLPADEQTLWRIREASAVFSPMGIGTCIEVDTSQPVDTDAILDRLRAVGIEPSATRNDGRSTDQG